MNLKELRTSLREACDKLGSVHAWAMKHEVTDAYVGGVLNGKKPPGPKILKGLKLKKVVSYEKR